MLIEKLDVSFNIPLWLVFPFRESFHISLYWVLHSNYVFFKFLLFFVFLIKLCFFRLFQERARWPKPRTLGENGNPLNLSLFANLLLKIWQIYIFLVCFFPFFPEACINYLWSNSVRAKRRSIWQWCLITLKISIGRIFFVTKTHFIEHLKRLCNTTHLMTPLFFSFKVTTRK